MRARWSLRILLVAILLTGALPLVAAPPPRNWQQCPAVVSFDTDKVVYALGDTHGDYERLVALLAGAKLIKGAPTRPERVQWTGGDAVLVVTGDMIDKWKFGLDVIALLRALTRAAAAQGGRVIISAGNHEAEFLADPNGTKTKMFREELVRWGGANAPRQVADGTDQGGIGRFLLCLPFATRVNGWFFSHAGSTGGRTLPQLIAAIESGFKTEGYKTGALLDANSGLLEARMKPPWWQNPGDTPAQSIARLRGNATALGVQHIVFGHQPGKYEFNDGAIRKKGVLFHHFDGLFFMIDRGMSRGIGDDETGYSHGGLLRIVRTNGRDVASEILPDGTQKRLWP